MKRAAIYIRVSTADQHPETQLYDLREMARQRGYEIVHEYSDTISGAKSKRPGLDQLLADARRRKFDIVLVAAFDRVAEACGIFLKCWMNCTSLGWSLSASAKTSTPVARSAERWSSSLARLRNCNEA